MLHNMPTLRIWHAIIEYERQCPGTLRERYKENTVTKLKSNHRILSLLSKKNYRENASCKALTSQAGNRPPCAAVTIGKSADILSLCVCILRIHWRDNI